MSTGWLDNSFLLLLGVAGIWFYMRFVLGPRRGGPGLRSFFRREARMSVDGLGQNAIATLLADIRAFAIGEAALRGLILAGPFAARSAQADSSVILIALSDAPQAYLGSDWLLRWAYPARGHPVLWQREEQMAGQVVQHLGLRGAPPLEIHFVTVDRAAPPEILLPALAFGTRVIDDPAGQAERLCQRWESFLRHPAGAETKKE